MLLMVVEAGCTRPVVTLSRPVPVNRLSVLAAPEPGAPHTPGSAKVVPPSKESLFTVLAPVYDNATTGEPVCRSRLVAEGNRPGAVNSKVAPLATVTAPEPRLLGILTTSLPCCTRVPP